MKKLCGDGVMERAQKLQNVALWYWVSHACGHKRRFFVSEGVSGTNRRAGHGDANPLWEVEGDSNRRTSESLEPPGRKR